MSGRNGWDQFVDSVLTSPAVVKIVALLTTGTGLSTLLGWLENGIGLFASLVAVAVSLALYRKLQTERRATDLLIEERRLQILIHERALK